MPLGGGRPPGMPCWVCSESPGARSAVQSRCHEQAPESATRRPPVSGHSTGRVQFSDAFASEREEQPQDSGLAP